MSAPTGSRTRDLADSNDIPRSTSQAPAKSSIFRSQLILHIPQQLNYQYKSRYRNTDHRPRRSHRRHSPAWPLDRVGAARRRNGCGSPRGTQTTGSSGLDRSNASIGSCVPSRSFGRWWRGVHRTRHCWPQVSSSPLSHGLCGQRSCLPSLAVRG